MSFRDVMEELDDEVAAPDAEALERDIAEIEALLAPFDSEAWRAIAAQIAGEAQSQLGLMVRAQFSTEQLWQARGRAQALQWALDLPERLRAEVRRLTAELEEARPEEEEEASP